MLWRSWIKGVLASYPPLTAIVPAGLHFGAGSLTKAPEKRPWIVIRLTDNNPVPGIKMVQFQGAEIWAYGEPGSYIQVDEVLRKVKEALLQGSMGGDGIGVEWEGDSPELSDELFGAIVRFSSFRLVSSGREG